MDEQEFKTEFKTMWFGRYIDKDDGNEHGIWLPITCKEREDIVEAAGGVKALTVFANLISPLVVIHIWGMPGEKLPLFQDGMEFIPQSKWPTVRHCSHARYVPVKVIAKFHTRHNTQTGGIR